MNGTSVKKPSAESVVAARGRISKWLEHVRPQRALLGCGRFVMVKGDLPGRGIPPSRAATLTAVYEVGVSRDIEQVVDEILVAAAVAFASVLSDPNYPLDYVIYTLSDADRRVAFNLCATDELPS